MHRCLQIHEILHNVLDNIALAASLRDLFSVALVSKAFNEPALDALWAFQDSLLLLIKTFPADLWIESGDPKKLVGFVFCLQFNSYSCSKQDFSTTSYQIRS